MANKIGKKVIGLALVGIMSIGSLASITSNFNDTKIAYAVDWVPEPGEPGYDTYNMLEAKLSHLKKSMGGNYWGIKNQGTWEGYIKELKDLVEELKKTVDAGYIYRISDIEFYEGLIKFIAKINQVEKSYDSNYHGIKNAAQWRVYLDSARNDAILKEYYAQLNGAVGLDLWYLHDESQERFLNLLERLDTIEAKIKVIEDAHDFDIAKVQAKLDEARSTNSLSKAEEALEDANKLGTHKSTTRIKNEIEDFIKNIGNTITYAEPSLTVVDTTTTSVTVDVVFPDSNGLNFLELQAGAYGNGSDSDWRVAPGTDGGKARNGRYTFDNLQPGRTYNIIMTYKYDTLRNEIFYQATTKLN